jgi:glycosyltransferase involved in cell wall biosynthesis
MRVLHVIPSLDKRDGGPSVALPLMARSLAMQGIVVDVATTLSEGDALEAESAWGEPCPREGFTLRCFKRQSGFYKVSVPLLQWLAGHVRDYDLVHNHAVFSFAPLAGACAARRRQVPYIMRPLGLLNKWGMENRRRWLKAFSFKLLDKPALNGAAAIHYTSQEEELEAARLHLSARAVVLPLGIDIAPFRDLPDKREFVSRHSVAADRQIVLFLSRLDPKKGIESLLDAIHQMRSASDPKPNPLLVLAGEGSAAYVATLQSKVESLQLQQSVLWTGFLAGPEKLAAMAAADVFVLPSFSENFGIALVEAMAAGRPCVTTSAVAIARELHESAAGVVLPPGDSAALAMTLAKLLRDATWRNQLGANAARLAAARFSLSAMGTALASLYESVCPRVFTPIKS